MLTIPWNDWSWVGRSEWLVVVALLVVPMVVMIRAHNKRQAALRREMEQSLRRLGLMH